ncbi:MAG: hypothetical protein OXU61_04910, partial [Gammaproteobacteria bacterium]|nr:hypothetical protein [Gammaproteobacteria bacterium]
TPHRSSRRLTAWLLRLPLQGGVMGKMRRGQESTLHGGVGIVSPRLRNGLLGCRQFAFSREDVDNLPKVGMAWRHQDPERRWKPKRLIQHPALPVRRGRAFR